MLKPCLVSILALLAGLAPAAGAAAPQEVRYTFLFSGNKAGSLVTRVEPDGERVCTFEFNDRGRGPKTETRFRLGAGGIPVSEHTTGYDYWKTPVDERYERTGAKASWKNAAENGERQLTVPAFYLGLNAPPQEFELLTRALVEAPGGRLPLLPVGEAHVEKIDSRKVSAGGKERTADLYAVHGLGFSPGYEWLDSQHHLFAGISGWAAVVPEGWEGVIPELTKAQDAAEAARQKTLAAKLPHRPKGPLVLQHARLFDPESGKLVPETTVVVAGNRIQAVGHDGEVATPAGAEVIDTKGKTLLPGLWDMHTHLGDDDGLLNLAAGVTTVRDMANDIDKLRDLKRRWESGEAVGPRVLMAGFMDGPGPFAGPTKVLVSTEKEALDWVDRYAAMGYVQIKLYSSLDPKLVPAIARRAHEKGLRLSGHIPNGMTAEEAVRAGYDEIQHVNFLVLNFLDRGIDTRSTGRFTEVGQHAAELDLNSDKVKDFIALLKERGTVSDPTLATFEALYMAPANAVGPTYAGVVDRFPPQVRRNFVGGGLTAPPGQEQRYHDSFRAMENLVLALHKAGVTIVAGTDALCGFTLHRELELYVDAGFSPVDALRAATLVPARVMKRDQDLGTVAPGKLADLILVDGDPTARISDVRRVMLTVKDGVVYDPAALYRALEVQPIQ
ncbi:MAG TPA: amidohydrolase family protein [Thermoanaerobaculia bacterium]|jgi:cytosine/adenosine deaminase-related metal-dependent hydrolase|nr:amidohydrolase family protein [Thermoanaerobaculia bacterium]